MDVCYASPVLNILELLKNLPRLLAAHYRFGARTAGSNLMIGVLFVGLAIIFGNRIVQVFNLIPMPILGMLLIFAGAQLTLAMMDLDRRKDLFVATLILGITPASNLAAGFIAGQVIFIGQRMWYIQVTHDIHLPITCIPILPRYLLLGMECFAWGCRGQTAPSASRKSRPCYDTKKLDTTMTKKSVKVLSTDSEQGARKIAEIWYPGIRRNR